MIYGRVVKQSQLKHVAAYTNNTMEIWNFFSRALSDHLMAILIRDKRNFGDTPIYSRAEAKFSRSTVDRDRDIFRPERLAVAACSQWKTECHRVWHRSVDK